MTSPITQKKHAFQGKAFTLIELLLVTIIAGIILGLTIPQVGKSFAYLRLKNVALDIAAVARYAQATAIVEEKPYRLNLDMKIGKHWLTHQVAFGAPGEFKRLKTSFGRDSFLPREVKIDSVLLEDEYMSEQDFITFYPDGRLDQCKITLSNEEGERLQVIVTGKIGLVKVSPGVRSEAY